MFKRRGERGQALVELALTLSILLTVSLGMVDVGRVLHAYLSTANASREGARVAALGYDDSMVLSTINGSLSGAFDLKSLTIAVSPEQSLRFRGEPVTVQVKVPLTILFPGFGAFAENPLEVVGKTVMRME